MDREVIDRKFESLRRCVKRIEEKTPKSAQALAKSLDAQDILSINLERALRVAVDIASHLIAELELAPPDTLANAFQKLSEAKMISPELATNMQKTVGFRNILVHEYETVNWNIVFQVATAGLSVFRDYIAAVDAWLSKQEPR